MIGQVAGKGDEGRLLSIGWISMSGCRSFGGCGANVASLVRELLWDNAASQLVQRPVAVREPRHFLRYYFSVYLRYKKRSLYQDRLGTNIGQT